MSITFLFVCFVVVFVFGCDTPLSVGGEARRVQVACCKARRKEQVVDYGHATSVFLFCR